MASCKVFGAFMVRIYADYSRVSSIYLPEFASAKDSNARKGELHRPKLGPRFRFKSYSNQEGSLSLAVRVIRRIQRLRLTERTLRALKRSSTRLLLVQL